MTHTATTSIPRPYMQLLRRATHQLRGALRQARPDLHTALNDGRIQVGAQLLGNIKTIVVAAPRAQPQHFDARNVLIVMVQVIACGQAWNLVTWMPATGDEDLCFSPIVETADHTLTVGTLQRLSEGLVTDLVARLDHVWRSGDATITRELPR